MVPQRGNDAGFTLLEVLVSMVILMIGVLGHALFTLTVIKTNSSSAHYAAASALAQDKLEELSSYTMTHSSLADIKRTNNSASGLLSTAASDVDYQETGIDESGNAGGIYTRTWNIWDVSSRKKEIAVIVSWQDSGSNGKSVRYSTVKSY